MPLPEKPRYTAPCNHCGQCCDRAICHIGELAFPGAKAPCPGLLILENGNAALCGIVATEKAFGLPPMIAKQLGDRFKAHGSIWTFLGGDQARKHSEDSINLRERGSGYTMDTICAFDKSMKVEFVPV